MAGFFTFSRARHLPCGSPVNCWNRLALLRQEAWLSFTGDLGRERGSPTEAAFAELASELSLDSLHKLLDALLASRAEWWASHPEAENAVPAACHDLENWLGVRETDDLAAALFNSADWQDDLACYHTLLSREGAALSSEAKRQQALENGMQALPDAAAAFSLLCDCLLTQEGNPRKLKTSKAMEKRLGAADSETYLALHVSLAERMETLRNRLGDQRALRLNRLGLTAGVAYLDTYRRLKMERGALDFNDGELETLRLLDNEEAAAALLMKLDARWKHLLLDEFQDTNPLQWRILRTWLEAYGGDGERPTLFLVGDPKQSIYRFRRAEPRLFDAAANWLAKHYAARHFPQNETRRCAPRIVAWVNSVFAQRDDYPIFEPHSAHESDLPGWCEIRRVVPVQEVTNDIAFRNPLTTPPLQQTHARAAEATWVGERINQIVGRLQIGQSNPRPARYGDILLLYATRRDLEVFESAFRQKGIPYISDRRGGLLDTLEVDDLQRLLTVLVTPFDDLALAQSLKSPLFGLGDSDLKQLARGNGPWWQRLLAWADATDAPLRIVRAARLLSDWRGLAGSLPVHDLLDRIFHQADVTKRYAAAVPARLIPGVLANLQGFLALSLQHEGGRYPSLPRFLEELRQLRTQSGAAGDGPDEPSAAQGDAVRMLTIHSAKGLEAPIVFLLKADQNGGPDAAYGVLLDWPPEADRPSHFSLHGGKDWRGPGRDVLFEQSRAQAAREKLNLLYVSMTRARQALFISGLGEVKENAEGGGSNWLDMAESALSDANLNGLPEMHWSDASIVTRASSAAPGINSEEQHSVEALPLSGIGSRCDPGGAEAEFGIQVHAWLEGLCQGWSRQQLLGSLGTDVERATEIETIAQRIFGIPELGAAFDPSRYLRAFNELEFLDIDGRLARIDRLVEFETEVWVIDYKTGGLREADLALRALPHLQQMACYRDAAQNLFAGKPVRVALAFADGQVYWV
jgi:ATP-dependent helicase/nuclease subunit A